MNWKENLKSLGLELPEVVPPVASYIAARQVGNMIWVSGQLPMKEGKLMIGGVLDNNSDVELAKKAAAQSFLNGLAAANSILEAEQELASVLRMRIFVASSPSFTRQAYVANGASDLAVSIFGEGSRHVRSAMGVASLPLGAAVEVEMEFALK